MRLSSRPARAGVRLSLDRPLWKLGFLLALVLIALLFGGGHLICRVAQKLPPLVALVRALERFGHHRGWWSARAKALNPPPRSTPELSPLSIKRLLPTQTRRSPLPTPDPELLLEPTTPPLTCPLHLPR